MNIYKVKHVTKIIIELTYYHKNNNLKKGIIIILFKLVLF